MRHWIHLTKIITNWKPFGVWGTTFTNRPASMRRNFIHTTILGPGTLHLFKKQSLLHFPTTCCRPIRLVSFPKTMMNRVRLDSIRQRSHQNNQQICIAKLETNRIHWRWQRWKQLIVSGWFQVKASNHIRNHWYGTCFFWAKHKRPRSKLTTNCWWFSSGSKAIFHRQLPQEFETIPQHVKALTTPQLKQKPINVGALLLPHTHTHRDAVKLSVEIFLWLLCCAAFGKNTTCKNGSSKIPQPIF